LKVTSVNDTYYKDKKLISLWPNPASDYFTVDAGERVISGSVYVSILDLSGRELIKVPYSEQIDISSLHEGMYIVITTLNGKPLGYNRLIKKK
jgi:hypothetical protein